MKFKMFCMAVIFCLLFLPGKGLCLEKDLQPVDKWLVLGPAGVSTAEKNLLKNTSAVLGFDFISLSGLLPSAGETVTWASGEKLKWRVLRDIKFSPREDKILYLSTYLESYRWLQAKLQIEKGDNDLHAAFFLDGKKLKTGASAGKITADLTLADKKHILILKVLLPKGVETNIKAFLKKEEDFKEDKILVSLTPRHRVSEENIINIKNVRRIEVSPNGKFAAVSLNQTEKGSGAAKSWVEILDAHSGKVVFNTGNFGKISGIEWLKDPGRFSYTMTKKGKTSLYIYNLNNHTTKCLLKEIKDFSDYWWAADNSFLIYTVNHTREKDAGYKFIKELPDRRKHSGTRCAMYVYFPGGGVTHKISGREENFDTALISPDSKKALLIKDEADSKNRPYRKSIVCLFDLKTFTIKPFWQGSWFDSVHWSPDGKKLLILAGPSAFGGIGRNLPEGKIPNDYDSQAFICDAGNPGQVEPITKDFAPSIRTASWSSSAGYMYFQVTDKSFVNIYKYSVKNKSFKKLNTKVDVIGRIGFAANRNTAVFWGSSARAPHKLYRLNLSSGNAGLLKDYNRDAFKHVRVGSVTPWNFKTEVGKTITGRIHYPVNFDKNKKYPCIVYYYGGTSPVSRSFGGRYPFNWYTAKGYIVYVLQPSGAVGFGQDFSAAHVNDWGKTTSVEITAGVKKLLKAHPYIDPGAVGAMGASYGGFMTQYLATYTDIFGALISHAGIASLASYWGVGDWGYTYSAIATAESFPWNRKDIYVGHSPLFRADRINTPLLLLHGEEDNNVPPGESYQMFAALKLLKKEVALITFAGQKHFILEYEKRLQWMHSIIAWFDKHLKKQPQYWNHLYPEK
ncbi:MAG: S9 family peptidase [Candidatus Aminicenantes bacterium]|nr:S9 family peptidase [Candidatus Aminicenantes bacterium]